MNHFDSSAAFPSFDCAQDKPRRAHRLTDPFAGWTQPLPGIRLSCRLRIRRSLAFVLVTALRLLFILAVLGALLLAGVLLGLFAFQSAQALIVIPTPTATSAPTRTPVPTPTPTPSPTPLPPPVGIGRGLAYIWESKAPPDSFDNVFSCLTCGNGMKPDNREYFVCATGYEAELKGKALGELEHAPGWDIPGVCIIGVWGATFDRMAIGISADIAKALAVTPGKVPEIEIYAGNIPDGYLFMRPAGSEQHDTDLGTPAGQMRGQADYTEASEENGE